MRMHRVVHAAAKSAVRKYVAVDKQAATELIVNLMDALKYRPRCPQALIT